MKRALILVLLFNTSIALAQTDPFDTYLDFNEAIVNEDLPSALALSKTILDNIDRLKPASRVAFYAKLAKVCQDSGDNANALLYFEKVIESEPDYYVPHWAVANIYLERSEELKQKIAMAKNDRISYDQYESEYRTLMYKAIGHLEKTQACDPTPETLKLIKKIYRNYKDTVALKTLNSRLKKSSANCITLLPDA